MSRPEITVTEIIQAIMPILECYGYDKHTLWGTMNGEFLSIAKFYRDNHVSFYNPEETAKFIKILKERYKAGEIHRAYYGTMHKAAARLDEYYFTGVLEWSCNKRGTKFKLNHEYKRLLDNFLSSKSFHHNTRWDFAWAIRKYLYYFQGKGINTLEALTINDVRQFIIDIAASSKAGSLHNLLCYIRQFHEFLKETGEPAPDCIALLSYHVPRKMPVHGYVSDNELERIMAQINTSSRMGKRDLAIISLGATTGLRAIDVVHLRLNDINWYNGEIRLIQSKTNGMLVLPLIPETGEAIKDYILNARPESECPEVFLREKAPYQAFFDGVAIGYIFNQYAKKAGIKRVAFDGKSFHGLRRRLAKNMLVAGTPVTTIAQVLGHENMESTKQYFSLDGQNLKECALDFSGIPPKRGGLS